MIIIVYINKDRNMHRDMLEFLIKQLTVFASLIYPSNCKKKNHGTPLTLLSPFCQRYNEDLSRVRCVNCNGIKTVYNVAHTNRVCACHEFAQHVNNLLWLYSARTSFSCSFLDANEGAGCYVVIVLDLRSSPRARQLMHSPG